MKKPSRNTTSIWITDLMIYCFLFSLEVIGSLRGFPRRDFKNNINWYNKHKNQEFMNEKHSLKF